MIAVALPLLLAASSAAPVTSLGEALATRDVAKAIEVFTPDASIRFVVDSSERKRIPDEVFVGPDQVRDFLSAYLPGWEATATDVRVDGERASWDWQVSGARLERLGVKPLEAKAEASFRAGKIRSLTFTASAAQQPKLVQEIPEVNKAIVRGFIDRVNARDYTVLDDTIALSFEQHSFMPMGPGAQGLKDFYKEFSRAFPDFRFTLEDVLAEGDRVAVRMTARYTHKGEYMGIAPTNKPVVVTKFDIFRFSGGKCIEHWDSVDRLGLLQQLGVLPRLPRWSATPGYEGFR